MTHPLHTPPLAVGPITALVAGPAAVTTLYSSSSTPHTLTALGPHTRHHPDRKHHSPTTPRTAPPLDPGMHTERSMDSKIMAVVAATGHSMDSKSMAVAAAATGQWAPHCRVFSFSVPQPHRPAPTRPPTQRRFRPPRPGGQPGTGPCRPHPIPDSRTPLPGNL